MLCNRLINIRHVPVRLMSSFPNKRITRIPSDVEVKQDELSSSLGNERHISTSISNRNPRNLEQMLFEPKPLGFEMDSPSKIFWNKVIFEKSGKFVSAKVVHYSGRVLVTASSKEVAFREQTNSTGDTNAAVMVGQILARRCLESGILNVHVELDKEEKKSDKIMKFLDSLQENGLTLGESAFIFPRRLRDN